MSSVVEMLKPTEAAVVAHVTLRDVNRMIDERILPEDFFRLDEGRYIAATACMLISFYVDSAQRLTSEERLSSIREISERLKGVEAASVEDWTMCHDFLTIDFAPFVRQTKERMERLAAAREIVVADPDILGGVPVVRGTRVPVYDVAASAAAGFPLERILAAYPSLDADKVALAVIYAQANPPRGRPRTTDEPFKDAGIVRHRQAPRRGRVNEVLDR